MNNLTIQKVWAMPNAKTFSIPPIKKFVERHIVGASVIIDPFANSCKYGTIRNDLNPQFDTQYHMDALAFLQTLPSGCADVVLYDPPYSISQAAEMYKSYGKDKLEISVANMGYWAKCKDNVARILKVGGVALTFGWCTNGIGKMRGFKQTEIMIVSHGGSKNDTLCSCEVKEFNNDGL